MGNPSGLGTNLVELNSNNNYDLRHIGLVSDSEYLDILNDLDIYSIYYDEDSYIGSFSNSNKIILMSLNICSIQSKFTEFNSLLDKLSENNSRPDIILIQESWVQDASHLNIKGFKSVLNARPRGSMGGGTMIYYNKSFNVTPILNDSFFRPNICGPPLFVFCNKRVPPPLYYFK